MFSAVWADQNHVINAHVLYSSALFLKKLCARTVRDQSEHSEMKIYQAPQSELI
jgi:hypothetical protein